MTIGQNGWRVSWVLSLVKLMASYPKSKSIHPLRHKGFPGPCVPRLGCHPPGPTWGSAARWAASSAISRAWSLIEKAILNLGRFTWHHHHHHTDHTLKFIKIEKLEIRCTTISNGDDEWFYPIAQSFTNEDPMLDSERLTFHQHHHPVGGHPNLQYLHSNAWCNKISIFCQGVRWVANTYSHSKKLSWYAILAQMGVNV